MRISRGMPLALLLLALGATAARAEGIADNLQCFKITDTSLRRIRGIVDLDAPSLGLAPGCKLGKAKLYCVPAKKTVQAGTLLDGNRPVTELPYHGPPAETDRVCYRLKCEKPNGTASDRSVTDPFGTHEFSRLTTEMLCTPATRGTLPPPAEGFQIKTPPIELQPYQQLTYCYYFRTPNSVTVPVKRWVSELAPGTQSIAVFTTTTPQGGVADKQPPGTLTNVDCDFGSFGAVRQHPVYTAYTPSAELVLPTDDGAGNPVAMEIPPNSSGFILMEHRNLTDQVQTTSVTINAEALASPIYTTAATFLTYDGSIAIPPYTNGYVVSGSCDVPAGAQIWQTSTHTHKFAVDSVVRDGANVLFEATDWTNPGAQTWPTPPFYEFSTDRLTYACTYDNPTNLTIRPGNSLQYEEQCVSVSFFFPGTQSHMCYNGFPLY